MASQQEKTQGHRFVKGSYAIPSFVLSKEDYDSMYDIAFLRMEDDDKLHYYGIYDETGEEYEMSSSRAWGKFYDMLMQSAMSHDIIPACIARLKADGWKESEYESYILDGVCSDILDYYEADFQFSSDITYDLECLPKTHDDWFIKLLDWWQKSKPFVYGDLAKNEEDICFYPYLHDYLEDRLVHIALSCSYSDERTIDLINDLRQDIEGSRKQINKKKKATKDDWLRSFSYTIKRWISFCSYDIGITPYRENNQVLREGLTELNSLCPEMMSAILTGVADYFKNRPCRYDSDIKYRDRVLEFIAQIQQEES